MSKILMVNVPYSGHTNPTLPLTRQLVNRGHQVTYINAPEWKEKIEATGAVFVPYLDYPEGLSAQQKKVRCFKAAFHTAMQVGAGHDLLIYEMFFYLGKTIADRLGIPCVRQFSQPAWSAKNAGRASFLRRLSCLIIDAQVLNRKVAAELGVKDKRLIESVLYDKAAINIVYLPEKFQPYRQDFDQSFVFCVPPMQQLIVSKHHIPFEKMAKPIIYISMGSIISSKIFCRRCIKAFGNRELSVILNTGKVNPEELGNIPPNIWAYSFVPQLEVLQNTDLFITHGGMNSVNEAMYYGVPMLVMPIVNDQPVNAQRVEKLNLGRKVRAFPITAAVLYKRAMDVLNSHDITNSCKNMEKEIKQGITIDNVIDIIEGILQEDDCKR
ncbi:MAG: glycosyl transferase [Ruminiclostridium sp.]|nr:glycosyl transferase [Ruminiclostridium sp.]